MRMDYRGKRNPLNKLTAWRNAGSDGWVEGAHSFHIQSASWMEALILRDRDLEYLDKRCDEAQGSFSGAKWVVFSPFLKLI